MIAGHWGFHKGQPQRNSDRGGGSQFSSGQTGVKRGWQAPGNKGQPNKSLAITCSTKTAICSVQQNLLKAVSCTHVINTQTQGLINLLIGCPKLAGRVAFFLPNWEVLHNQSVLQTVAGY